MKKTTKRIFGKCLAVCLILITLGSLVFSLSSCTGGTSSATSWKMSDYTWEIKKDADGNDIASIDITEFNFIANLIADNSELKNKFLAASRGNGDVNADVSEYERGIAFTHTEYDIEKIVTTVTGSAWYNTRSEVDLEAAIAVLNAIIDDNSIAWHSKDTDLGAVQRIRDKWNEYLSNYKDNKSAANLAKLNECKDEAWLIAQLPSMHYSVSVNSDPGLFDYILIGVGWVMGKITNLLGGQYLVALLVFAIIIELAMLPIAIKQQKNTIGMAKLRPMIAKIEKKYAGRYDRATQQKKQQEIMELQQKSGFSPMSGCLPLIIQLIVVGFILYPIIQNPLQYMLNTSSEFGSALTQYVTSSKALGGLGISMKNGNVMEVLSYLNADNIQGITEFELLDMGSRFACLDNYIGLNAGQFNFNIFGLNGGLNPYFWSWLLVIPVLNLLAQLGSMWISKKIGGQPTAMATGPDGQTNAGSFQMMNLIAPILTLVIMFSVPAMIGVYWLIRTVLSTVTRVVVSRFMPAPKYTEEELREIEKAEREQRKAQKEMQNAPHRSLHYIDEDDYDELPDTPDTQSNIKRTDISSDDAPEIKD